VDQSTPVAATNPIDLAFDSKQAGTVRLDPILALLIAQIWLQWRCRLVDLGTVAAIA
jgi:hypothetical protein